MADHASKYVTITGWPDTDSRSYTLSVVEGVKEESKNQTELVCHVTNDDLFREQQLSGYLRAVVNGIDIFNDAFVESDSFPPQHSPDQYASKNIIVSHDADGTKTVTLYITATINNVTISKTEELTLTPYDITAPTLTVGTPVIDIGSVTIPVTTDKRCSQWSYRYKPTGGSWSSWITTSSTGSSYDFSINGLSANKEYTVQLSAKNEHNGLWGYANDVVFTTYGGSRIISAADTEIGERVSIRWTHPGGPQYYTLRLQLGSWSWETPNHIVPTGGTEYLYDTYRIPDSIASQIPNAGTGICWATLTTYRQDGYELGKYTKSFNVIVPDRLGPDIVDLILSEGSSSGFNVFAKSVTTVQADVEVDTYYEATITNVKIEVDGVLKDGRKVDDSNWTATSDYLKTAGVAVPVTVYVTDSRGKTTSEATTITVYDYWVPYGEMDASVTGTTVTIHLNGSIAPVNNRNTKSVVVTARRLSDDNETEYSFTPASFTLNETYTLTVSDIGTETYEFIIEISDRASSTTLSEQTGFTAVSLLGGGAGVTLFGPATEQGFWIQSNDKQIRHDITDAEYLEIASLLSDPYDMRSYYVGEFCTYNNKTWQCKTAIPYGGENWNASHWDEIGAVS